MKPLHRFSLMLLMASCPLMASAVTYESSMADRQGLSLTVYEQSQTLVRDTRSIKTGQGRFGLVVRDVSERIQPETLMLESNGRLRLSGATFNTALLTPENLMKAYIGKEVTLVHTNPATGQETIRRAKLLSMHGGGIVQVDGHIETVSTDRLVFDRVPEGLYPSPVLMLDVQGGSGGRQQVTFDYLTGGLSWQADYTAVVGEHDDRMSLASWAVIGNNSGVDYRNAKVQLMSGKQERGSVYPRAGGMLMMAKAMDTGSAMANDTASEEAFADYHLYTVPDKVDIQDKQTSRYRLLSADRVKVVKEYRFNGNQWVYESRQGQSGPVHAGIWLSFDNKKGDGLGMPLPRGTIRFYQEDRSGNRQLLGQNTINHTPVDGHLHLRLGEAFDVTMVRKQTGYSQMAVVRKDGEKVYRTDTSWELALANGKSDPVTVRVEEALPENGRVVGENHPHKKQDANTVIWQVPVPANGKTVLKYKVQVN